MAGAKEKLGLIAGNGRFPFLVLDAARAQGFEVVVAAIKEETFPEIESRGAAAVHWLSLGELSKLIETFQQAGVVERHYGRPQDIEWAIDHSGEILLLQSRPETVWSSKERAPVAKPTDDPLQHVMKIFGGRR